MNVKPPAGRTAVLRSATVKQDKDANLKKGIIILITAIALLAILYGSLALNDPTIKFDGLNARGDVGLIVGGGLVLLFEGIICHANGSNRKERNRRYQSAPKIQGDTDLKCPPQIAQPGCAETTDESLFSAGPPPLFRLIESWYFQEEELLELSPSTAENINNHLVQHKQMVVFKLEGSNKIVVHAKGESKTFVLSGLAYVADGQPNWEPPTLLTTYIQELQNTGIKLCKLEKLIIRSDFFILI